MTDFDDDPGAWVRELDERRAFNFDPYANVEPASAADDGEYREMIRHRGAFEQRAYDLEKARGRSLTPDELRDAWNSAGEQRDVPMDLSWLDR